MLIMLANVFIWVHRYVSVLHAQDDAPYNLCQCLCIRLHLSVRLWTMLLMLSLDLQVGCGVRTKVYRSCTWVVFVCMHALSDAEILRPARCSPAALFFLNPLFSKPLNQPVYELRDRCLNLILTTCIRGEYRQGAREEETFRRKEKWAENKISPFSHPTGCVHICKWD